MKWVKVAIEDRDNGNIVIFPSMAYASRYLFDGDSFELNDEWENKNIECVIMNYIIKRVDTDKKDEKEPITYRDLFANKELLVGSKLIDFLDSSISDEIFEKYIGDSKPKYQIRYQDNMYDLKTDEVNKKLSDILKKATWYYNMKMRDVGGVTILKDGRTWLRVLAFLDEGVGLGKKPTFSEDNEISIKRIK